MRPSWVYDGSKPCFILQRYLCWIIYPPWNSTTSSAQRKSFVQWCTIQAEQVVSVANLHILRKLKYFKHEVGMCFCFQNEKMEFNWVSQDCIPNRILHQTFKLFVYCFSMFFPCYELENKWCNSENHAKEFQIWRHTNIVSLFMTVASLLIPCNSF